MREGPDYFPKRINMHVPNMQYAADVRFGGVGTVELPAAVAADADGILSAQSIAAAGNTGAFAATYSDDAMAKFGRNVTAIASGASTATVTVTGRDYLGQRVTEELTLNGAATVKGKKAFASIDNVAWTATAATTVNVGWGDILGLPYKLIKSIAEVVDGVEAANAGTFVVGSDAAVSATSADTRGTYTPAAANVADGSKAYSITGLWDTDNLHGNVQYAA